MNTVQHVCAVHGCGKHATHAPVIKMWSATKDHPPLLGQLDIKLCADHALELCVDDLMSAEAFAFIAAEMLMRGHEPPDRRTAEVEMVELADGP